MIVRMVLLLVIVLAPASVQAGHSVREVVFRDSDRQRDVPVKIYAPEPLEGAVPFILISHGLGGSRDSVPYLGEALAEAGYVTVHMQHIGTDKSVWEGKRPWKIKGALKAAMQDPNAAKARFEDVPFVLDVLAELPGPDPLAGHLDFSRIGMAGHSYGAVSTIVAAGQRMGPGARLSFKEPRVKAGFLMSPNVPRSVKDLNAAYKDIGIPLFHATGTKDNQPFAGKDFDPAVRTKPYETLTIPDQYLVVFDGADHGAFSGRSRRNGNAEASRYTQATAKAALLFFEAYLQGDATAKTELRSDYQQMLDAKDRYEWK